MESNLTNIQGVARRGIVHAAFSTKEIREISALKDLDIYIDSYSPIWYRNSIEDQLQELMGSEPGLSRAAKRRTEFMM